MKLAFDSPPSEIKGNLVIHRKIGRGKFGVYYTTLENCNHTEFALKAFPKDQLSAVQYKKELLAAQLRHPNVIQYSPLVCDKSNFNYILSEYAPNGDFFDLVQKDFFGDEIVVRTYFHQLIEGIEHVHAQGIAHLDLKLENLMLGRNYFLKIIDFDQAQNISDKHITSGGTIGYRAPEVMNGKCKDLEAADIYSLGVILYALKAKEYPFVETDSKLLFYSAFKYDNKNFWKLKAERVGRKDFFSESFINLLNGMLTHDPKKRLKLKDIKASRWYNEPILEQNVLQEKMIYLKKLSLVQ